MTSHNPAQSASQIGPSELPFGCVCDPYDDLGPARHDKDCPAVVGEVDWMNRHRRKLPLLDALLAEMERQDGAYGWFESNVKGVRLAIAALEDEAEETRHAWRAERKAEGWPETIIEAVQTAAVAMRLARDAARPDGSFM